MSPLLPSYLLTLRKRSGLSQSELAMLLGISASALCRSESLSRRPTIELAIGAEIIFGQSAKDIFPALYGDVERAVMDRVRKRRTRYAGRSKATNGAQLRTFDDILARASQPTLGL